MSRAPRAFAQESGNLTTKGLARLRRNQMSMMLLFGRNLNASYSPPRRGGVAAPSKKCREATKAAQTGWSVRLAFRRGAELTTPSVTNRNGSIFLMSRKPLFCEEGNVRAEKLCPKN